MKPHNQVWVKVNAPVDEGIAELVAVLSEVDGLETIASCQGEPAANPQEGVRSMAYVFFYFGDWQTISRFAFEIIAPAFDGIEGAKISVQIFNGSEPMGKLGVGTPSVAKLAAALGRAISRHKSLCSHDMERTAPRSC